MTPSARDEVGQPVAPPDGAANGVHPPPAPADEAVEVGTPAWDRLTQRRAELIYKKNRTGLSDDERAEFERLQGVSAAAIRRRFPPPDILTPEQRETLHRLLGRPPEPPGP